jgi:hypothetical protein
MFLIEGTYICLYNSGFSCFSISRTLIVIVSLLPLAAIFSDICVQLMVALVQLGPLV